MVTRWAHLRLDPSLLEKLRRGRLACGVSKVVGVSAGLLGCQQGCWGVSKVVGMPVMGSVDR